MEEAELRDTCKKLKIDVAPSMGKGKLIDELFGNTSEHTYIQPLHHRLSRRNEPAH